MTQPAFLPAFLLVLVTIIVMEFAVTLVHRYVMHGIGWAWHRSHHVPRRPPGWEKNDWFAVVFAAIPLALFVLGETCRSLWWIAFGISLYGVLYALLHEVLIHRRLPFAWRPKQPWLQRLIAAHHIHHAVTQRDGGVSFGFLYAPPVARLRAQIRARRNGGGAA